MKLNAAHQPRHRVLMAALVDHADPETRELSGVLIPYGEVGYTTIGPVIVPGPGRIKMLDADLSRIKLVDEHQEPPRSIGYQTAVRDTPDALRASYAVARTDDGNRAWAEYQSLARDAFSVELIDVLLEDNPDDPQVPLVVEATLKRTAFVTTPAWANARPDGLAANHNPEGNILMTEEQRARLRELAAMESRTDDEQREYDELAALAVGEATADDGGDDNGGDDNGGDDGGDDNGDGGDTGRASANASRGAGRPGIARVPGSASGRPRTRRTQRPLVELYAALARVHSGRSRMALEAALADITSSANIWTARDDYAGQLWSGLQYVRKFVPLMSPAPLTSYKGTGWRWVVKPEVADYAGDKAPVPSNEPETEETNWNAARLAGAHDLDRKFWDFGDQEFIAAYYEAMRESYAMKSDGKARAFLLASATAVGAPQTSLFKAAAVAAQAVEDNTNGQTADYFLINSTDRLALLDITNDDIPAYLEAFGVTPDKFIATPGQVAGTVTAGARPASTFRELSETPIRVEAINIANGGVDGGVFGYYATELNFAGGIAKATFA